MKPDKRLGQHFLRDAEVLQKITELVDLPHSPGCLEIGPGEGALTRYLVEAGKGKAISVIDFDERAIATLEREFKDRLQIHQGDATKADLEALLPEKGAVIVGNLPYNVASRIHLEILKISPAISRAVLMFQKEVALRLVAKAGTKPYGIPSILTQSVGKIALVWTIGPKAFFPPPKVDSAVIYFEPLENPLISASELGDFGHFLAPIFQKRRKTLKNALGDKALLFEKLQLDPKLRPEDLSPELWVALYRELGSPKTA